jgi:hypothetical protein
MLIDLRPSQQQEPEHQCPRRATVHVTNSGSRASRCNGRSIKTRHIRIWPRASEQRNRLSSLRPRVGSVAQPRLHAAAGWQPSDQNKTPSHKSRACTFLAGICVHSRQRAGGFCHWVWGLGLGHTVQDAHEFSASNQTSLGYSLLAYLAGKIPPRRRFHALPPLTHPRPFVLHFASFSAALNTPVSPPSLPSLCVLHARGGVWIIMWPRPALVRTQTLWAGLINANPAHVPASRCSRCCNMRIWL